VPTRQRLEAAKFQIRGERMTKMIVVCYGDSSVRFDRDYYTTKHFALTRECWGKYGLETVSAFFPSEDGDGWVSIGVYHFGKRSDVENALSAPETARVMADVKNFTDTTDIQRSIFTPLLSA
jgi:uncharacterized protein (TIGR02118 family)